MKTETNGVAKTERAPQAHPTQDKLFQLRDFIKERGGQLQKHNLAEIQEMAAEAIGWTFSPNCISKYMRRQGLTFVIRRTAKPKDAKKNRLQELEAQVANHEATIESILKEAIDDLLKEAVDQRKRLKAMEARIKNLEDQLPDDSWRGAGSV